MTNHLALALLILFFSVGCDSPAAATADESIEPTLKYTVKVGEKTITIAEGETVQLEGTLTNPQVSVTPDAYRVFPYQGVSFKYPRSFTFEADFEDPSAKNWTLSGNDFKIMFFALDETTTPAEFASNMIQQFGNKNAKITNANASLTLGNQKLSGTSLRLTVATHHMVMDVYRIPSPGKKTKLIVFQDNLDDSGNRSSEGKKTLADIASSFQVEP
jgi:hypothetical protein